MRQPFSLFSICILEIGHCIPAIGIPLRNHIIVLTACLTVLFLFHAVSMLIQIPCGGRHGVEAAMGLAKAHALAQVIPLVLVEPHAQELAWQRGMACSIGVGILNVVVIETGQIAVIAAPHLDAGFLVPVMHDDEIHLPLFSLDFDARLGGGVDDKQIHVSGEGFFFQYLFPQISLILAHRRVRIDAPKTIGANSVAVGKIHVALHGLDFGGIENARFAFVPHQDAFHAAAVRDFRKGFKPLQVAAVKGDVVAQFPKSFPDELRGGAQRNDSGSACCGDGPQGAFRGLHIHSAAFVPLIVHQVLHLVAHDIIEFVQGESMGVVPHFGPEARVGHHGHVVLRGFAAFAPNAFLSIIVEGIGLPAHGQDVLLDAKLAVGGVDQVQYFAGAARPLGKNVQGKEGFAAADRRFDDVDAACLDCCWIGNQIG